jgi:putative endopeptidase
LVIFYASCLDRPAIEADGAEADSPRSCRQRRRVSSKDDLLKVAGQLRRDGSARFFTFGVGADLRNSTETLMKRGSGRHVAPDRDYYLKDDAKNADTRQQYEQHMTRMFTLAGDSAETAAANAKRVLALETRLAQAQLDRVGRRDPKNRDNRRSATELKAMVPTIDLLAYFSACPGARVRAVNVGWPNSSRPLDNDLVSSVVR